ncbi:MAG: hypothetical protein ACO263_10270 [Cyclobacteriaceae bacterium]
MKKVVSIALLTLFTFTLGGYYMLFWMLEKQALVDSSYQLASEKISDQELIEIKIPITLPYPVQEGQIEKRSGTFNHDGQSFSIVKQKYENDVLTIWCYRNIDVEKIQNIKTTIDQKSSESNSGNVALSINAKLSQDFISDFIKIETVSMGWSQAITSHDAVPHLRPANAGPSYSPPWILG